ncbi:MAG: 4-hydroxy-tetrahydrodipicolinate synthase [Candidatus Fermentibacteraceae bacterium]|nr:4-hydroxy-tetrahydrodipicolinate synthase [Candidatus Fermentibacteraceae bacterium]
MFSGAITALVTPFNNGAIDTVSLRNLVNWQIEQGIDGLLACGCTGEAATLTAEEHHQVVRTVLEAAEGRVPVIAGTGTNYTASSVELSMETAALGVDAVLLITPYYNKPTPEGQIEHYTAVADEVDCPVILYNVPGRTGTNMLPETIARLAEHPRIVAVKDAAGSAERVTAILNLCDITVLSGDDAIAMAQVALGAAGVISVVSNIAPAAMSELISDTAKGNLQEARKIQARLYPVIKAMFIETNPMPVKKSLAMMGRIQDEIRLPLVSMKEEFAPELRRILEKADLF